MFSAPNAFIAGSKPGLKRFTLMPRTGQSSIGLRTGAFREVVRGRAVAWSGLGAWASRLGLAIAGVLCFLGLKGYPQQHGPAS